MTAGLRLLQAPPLVGAAVGDVVVVEEGVGVAVDEFGVGPSRAPRLAVARVKDGRWEIFDDVAHVSVDGAVLRAGGYVVEAVDDVGFAGSVGVVEAADDRVVALRLESVLTRVGAVWCGAQRDGEVGAVVVDSAGARLRPFVRGVPYTALARAPAPVPTPVALALIDDVTRFPGEAVACFDGVGRVLPFSRRDVVHHPLRALAPLLRLSRDDELLRAVDGVRRATVDEVRAFVAAYDPLGSERHAQLVDELRIFAGLPSTKALLS